MLKCHAGSCEIIRLCNRDIIKKKRVRSGEGLSERFVYSFIIDWFLISCVELCACYLCISYHIVYMLVCNKLILGFE